MLDTYIKNRGATKTIIHNNNRNAVNEINWDADYDGNVANIAFDINDNGKAQHYDISLDNQNLADILNIPSVKGSLHKRLSTDFKKPRRCRNSSLYNQETQLPVVEFIPPSPPSIEEQYYKLLRPEMMQNENQRSLSSFSPPINSFDDNILNVPDTFHTHFSSPKSNEELLIPLTIREKKHRPHTSRKHKKRTHRVYKIVKSPSTKSSKSSKSSSKKRSKSATTRKPFSLF